MLDEQEYAVAEGLYASMFRAKGPLEERTKPLVEYYQKLTGVVMYHNAIMHHRIAIYGPPCENCGKPYRTPRAAFCAACGHRRPNNETNQP